VAITQKGKNEAAKRWREIRGDDSLRVDHVLDCDSVVFDVGGYEGKWIGKIFSRYDCTIHVFEPVLEFANRIERRFAGVEKVHIHKFGLGHVSQTRPISVMRDSSSFYKEVGALRDAREVCALDFILGNRIETIDLMSVNIEGGEYDLLDHLIESGLMPKIKSIQIQFHGFIPGAEQRLMEIQKGLEKTHNLDFRFLFIWEGWSIENG
jgi:FkbM family methyltransferase